MKEWKQFHFKIDKKSLTLQQAHIPHWVQRHNVLSEADFQAVIERVNSLLEKPREMRKKMEAFRIASYAFCICLIGLIVFLPISVKYQDLLIKSLNESFCSIHYLFKKLNKARSRVHWKIVKRYKDFSHLPYYPRPHAYNWWEREQPAIENYEREDYVIILRVTK